MIDSLEKSEIEKDTLTVEIKERLIQPIKFIFEFKKIEESLRRQERVIKKLETDKDLIKVKEAKRINIIEISKGIVNNKDEVIKKSMMHREENLRLNEKIGILKGIVHQNQESKVENLQNFEELKKQISNLQEEYKENKIKIESLANRVRQYIRTTCTDQLSQSNADKEISKVFVQKEFEQNEDEYEQKWEEYAKLIQDNLSLMLNQTKFY